MRTTYRLNSLEKAINEDFLWALKAPEVWQHRGKYVVVHNKRVVAVGKNYAALVARAAAKEGCDKDVLVVMPVSPADLEEIPH